MDLFDAKSVKPMLIGESGEAFDSAEHIYELKIDGIRCVAYLGDGKTELRNKRLLNVNGLYPELGQIHGQVNARCILDGEVFVMRSGKPYFAEMQRRSLMSDSFKISLASKQLPVSFTAFDILYRNGEVLTGRPLMERKRILAETVFRESDRFTISRYIEQYGVSFYNLTAKQGLEGIVAKHRDSKYYMDKRTRDWTKCKNLLEDDFVVCGYIEKEQGVVSIVLGQYDEDQLVCKGHVTLGVSGHDFARIRSLPRQERHPFVILAKGNETANWVAPELVCTVKYMEPTVTGGMRQPVFKGLRDDKAPRDCVQLPVVGRKDVL